MKTDPQTIHRYLAATRDFAIQMMENAAYIQRNFPHWKCRMLSARALVSSATS
jgi:hypothetical protein